MGDKHFSSIKEYFFLLLSQEKNASTGAYYKALNDRGRIVDIPWSSWFVYEFVTASTF